MELTPKAKCMMLDAADSKTIEGFGFVAPLWLELKGSGRSKLTEAYCFYDVQPHRYRDRYIRYTWNCKHTDVVEVGPYYEYYCCGNCYKGVIHGED